MKMSVTLKKFGLQKAFDYLYKDPEKHIRTLFGWAEKYGGKMYPNQLTQVKDAIENPENPFYGYIRHLIHDVDPEVLKTKAMRTERKIRVQYSVDHPDGSYFCLQSALHRLLGG